MSSVNHDSKSQNVPFEGICDNHGYVNELRCFDCESWICFKCAFLNHKACKTLLLDEAYREMKECCSQRIEGQMRESNNRSDDIGYSVRAIELQEIPFLKQKIEDLKIEKVLKEKQLVFCEERMNKLKTINLTEANFHNDLATYKKLIEDSSTSEGFSKSENELDLCLQKGLEEAKRFSLYPSRKNIISLCKEKTVYAVDYQDETPFFGKLRALDGKIFISSFQQSKPTTIGRLFSLKVLLRSFTGSTELPHMTYLQMRLVDEKESYLNIEIDVNERTSRSENFILLCSGLKGENYKGLALIYKHSFYETPYTFGIQNGPPPVVKGIQRCGLKFMNMEGHVCGTAADSTFEIIVKNVMGNGLPAEKIGQIACGLEQLQILQKTGIKLVINESGIIL